MNEVVEHLLEKDELIDVKIPAGDYAILRELIEERRAMAWIKKWLQTGFLFVLGGSVVTVIGLWDYIRGFFK